MRLHHIDKCADLIQTYSHPSLSENKNLSTGIITWLWQFVRAQNPGKIQEETDKNGTLFAWLAPQTSIFPSYYISPIVLLSSAPNFVNTYTAHTY